MYIHLTPQDIKQVCNSPNLPIFATLYFLAQSDSLNKESAGNLLSRQAARQVVSRSPLLSSLFLWLLTH